MNKLSHSSRSNHDDEGMDFVNVDDNFLDVPKFGGNDSRRDATMKFQMKKK